MSFPGDSPSPLEQEFRRRAQVEVARDYWDPIHRARQQADFEAARQRAKAWRRAAVCAAVAATWGAGAYGGAVIHRQADRINQLSAQVACLRAGGTNC